MREGSTNDVDSLLQMALKKGTWQFSKNRNQRQFSGIEKAKMPKPWH